MNSYCAFYALILSLNSLSYNALQLALSLTNSWLEKWRNNQVCFSKWEGTARMATFM
uniref:Uncharacterized protein n=1 Tax=Rhizophora mucronata TaxID=61149 RepID=A0A2P2QJX5_RHIMU